MATKLLGRQIGNRPLRDNDRGPQGGEAVAIVSPNQPQHAFAALTGDIMVHDNVAGSQWPPVIAALSGGNYVVAWFQQGIGLDRLYFRIFNNAGVAQTGEIQVSNGDITFIGEDMFDMRVSIAALDNGDFVLAWVDHDVAFDQTPNGAVYSGLSHVFAQTFDANGGALGARFEVANAPVSGLPEYMNPSVGAFPGGGYLITYVDTDGLTGRIFSASGAGGTPFLLTDKDLQPRDEQGIATLSDGNLVALWEVRTGQQNETMIEARIITPSGPGALFTIGGSGPGQPHDAAAAGLAGGGFVATWTAEVDHQTDVYAQLYTANGTPAGNAFRVNAYTPGLQGTPNVVGMPDGGFVISFSSADSIAPYSTGIYAQRFSATGAALGGTWRVNDGVDLNQGQDYQEGIEVLSNGNIVFGWSSSSTTAASDAYNTYMRIFPGNEVPSASLTGTPQTDFLAGTAGNDVISGLGSNDALYGAGGNDNLDGGDGTDLADYDGLQSDYRVTVSNGVYTITDLRPGSPDGTDTLTNVEQLRFQNGTPVAIQDTVAPGSGGATPQGGEVRGNVTTAGTQSQPALAALSGGGFVMIWEDSANDGSGTGVFARRFAADGTAIGTVDLGIPTTTADDQRNPVVAGLADGGFLAVWESRNSGYDILARRFAADGTPAGDAFTVNTTLLNSQNNASISSNASGFAIAWQSFVGSSTDIIVRLYNASGTAVTAEIPVNTTIANAQERPAVAMLAGGGFVVTWESDGQDGSGKGIYARRFDAAGTAIGGEIAVNNVTAGSQALSAVTALAGGGFVVVWSDTGVHGRLYGADGQPAGTQFDIATSGGTPGVTALADGGFAVSWGGAGTGLDIFARYYDAAGVPIGGPFAVNETLAGIQSNGGAGALAQLADGTVAFAWSGEGTGDTAGVFARRFTVGADGNAGLIEGTPGNDTIPGTAGDDIIRGLGGNDTIDGLGGNDVADYSGNRSDYRVTVSNGVYTIDDQRDGSPDGTDTLTNVEQLRFGDGETVAIEDAVAPALPPSLNPLTGAVLINATAEPAAIFPMTVALSGGGYAVVWLSDFADTGHFASLRGRAFNAAGQPVGDEFDVGPMDFLSEEQVPSLTALAGGGFAVAWMTPGDNLADQYQDLQIQLYDATGGAGARINGGSTGRFSTPVLVGTPDGGFLVLREPEDGTGEFSATGQFYSSGGTAIGTAFPITANIGDHLSAAILTNGDIVMAWNELPQSGGERAFIRLFSPTGAPRGAEFVVDPAQPAGHYVPSVAALAGGGFVMTWFHFNPDTDVYARIFDAAGNPVTSTFAVNENTAGTQWYGYVEALDDGGFVVSWTGFDGNGDGVFARVFDASGQPRGGEVRVNPDIEGNQEGEIRHLAQLANGDLIISWAGGGPDADGVFTRRFSLGGTPAPDPIVGTPGPDTLIGTSGDDVIRGLGDNDILVGQGGADRMEGGAGNDTYYVENAGDLAVELAGEGFDAVYVYGIGAYTLAAGSEVEWLSAYPNAGTAAIDLTGNELGQYLVGNDGANVLDGGGGVDVLIGHGGNDIYYVDPDDLIVEGAGGGNDTVYVSVGYLLSAGIEVETLAVRDAAGTAAIGLTGNEVAQTLIGNAGDNGLDGLGGADVMRGLGGNDTYIVDNAGDQVIEAANEGFDAVYTTVSYTLTAGQEVEWLSTAAQGGTGAIDLTGNAFGQYVVGNNGANVLDGGAGNDTLIGNGGADTFAFTAALGANNVDVIADFVSGVDRIALDDAIFTALGGPGGLNAGAFVTGSAAGDADDRIVYNSATGQLFYDADGNGAGAMILFATLQGGPALSANDFIVI